MNQGTFVDHEGRPAVRFERHYRHPVDRVWAAVSTPEGLAHWFPAAVRLEPVPGGTIEFTHEPDTEPERGTVLRHEAPYRLSFSWGGDELHLELAPDGADGCTLTLVNVLEARDTAARNAAGWTVCLGELDEQLAGRPGSGPHGATAAPWKPLYDAYVAAGMPHGAQIPGRSGQD